MNESHRGLAFHPRTPEFLARVHGVTLQGSERGLPLFRDQGGRLFWGGWGSFYTLGVDLPSAHVLRDAAAVGREHGAVGACVSLPNGSFHVRHVNPLLELPATLQPEQRLDLYERNVKKHIRNTVAQSAVRYEIVGLPDEWQLLHASVMDSRGRHYHEQSYFSALADCFGEDLVFVSAHEGNSLVGGLVCLRHGDYLHLLSIAVDAAYRSERVDSGLYDRAILFSIEHKIRFVDFGLTDARNQPLVAHKRAFGAIPWQIVDRTFGTPLGKFEAFAGRAIGAVRRRFRK